MPKPIAMWSPARDVWEVETTGLFCEHSDVFSETWPTSGMTRNGTAYALPTSVPLTADSESSLLLPTPDVPTGGEKIPDDAIWVGLSVYRADGSKVQVHLSAAVSLLPTPRATRGGSATESVYLLDSGGLTRQPSPDGSESSDE